MRRMRENACGIDVGAKKVFVATENQPVVSFYTYTEEFCKLRDYLLDNKISTVAMEATGVYWVVLYEMLEEAGLDVWLVDGRQTKQLPGRKTDVKDCQWILELHIHGLLNRCLVVNADIKELRSYVRLREDHIRTASMHVNKMHQSLTLMNIRLKEVLSQTHGASGMAIIEAILNGERNREVLANLCHASILKTKKPQILAALEGKYTDAYLFSLKQAFDAYMFYQQMISECDIKITEVLKRINKDKIADIVDKTKSENKRKPIRHNKPKVENLGQHLLHFFEGQDATLISGITDYTWLELTSEIGTDLSRWSTEKHFTSWLGLSPGQNNSGKKRKNARKKGKPKAGQTFRLIAQSLINSKKVAIGEFGRRLRGRKGSAVAIKAMARKLAIIYWRIMNKGIEYVENGVKHYQEQIMRNKLKAFHRLANELKMDISILQ